MRGRTGSNVRPIETCKACEIRNVLRVDMIVLCKLHAAAPALYEAMENLLGPGAQLEHVCDRAEHDKNSPCIFCEARAALALATGERGGE